MAFKDLFSFLFQRSSGEERVAQYVIREHDRGRPLAEIMEDRYVLNRLQSPEQRARLLDRMISEQEAARAAERRAMVGTGDRSAKIRTYNFPQSRVTDHRINLSVHNLADVMNGDLEALVEALRVASREEMARG